MLYNQAVLTLGARIDGPAAFVSRLNDLLVSLAEETDGRPWAEAQPTGETGPALDQDQDQDE